MSTTKIAGGLSAAAGQSRPHPVRRAASASNTHVLERRGLDAADAPHSHQRFKEVPCAPYST